MERKTNLQTYFLVIEQKEYKKELFRIKEPYLSLLIDIGLLLCVDLVYKEDENIQGSVKNVFDKLMVTNNGEYINCILSVYGIKDGKHYISIAKGIAKFFNDEFPFEERDLNINLPLVKELIKGYELRDAEKNVLYSSSICLSNDLSEIRFTFFRNSLIE